ncbi:Ig-like domain-containing protein [Marinoscillum furvescens]|uniref:Putative secreted protein (Por secretion system target) n=1 Tax=Marinoscillum furvescens DSM 4134 TaxID=1122208 RepID=A0A3D9L1R3_MARFU|nr:Ig-like domain-containing protein [Marinoscillum furvescens]RED97529.1 putative secreted protein (Por secretion system target) [Marinoscillum furvescens DSM 4134]
MKKKEILLLCTLILALGANATVYNCSSVADIHNALANAVAGDEIVISAGTYTSTGSVNAAYYYGGANGTASNPITIRSASASNKAVLKGNSLSSKTVLRIEGDYWIVKDLEITYGQKGLVFDNSNHSQAINCTIHHFGNEAVHVRDGSDYVTIDGCTIYNTGNVNAGFGEGIYVGTDKGSWSSYDPYCNYTVVKNCSIGPNVRAEAFDIKEGTQETTVEYNTVDGAGISGSNYADSFMDLKGVRIYIRNNTFNQNGESIITKGIAAIDRGVAYSSYEHAIHDNVFNMDGASDNIVEAYSGTSDVHAWNNTRNPSGDMYNSRVSTTSCPSWYANCGSGGGSNQAPSVSVTAPSNGATYTDGDNVTITASASDSDGTISSVEFYQGSTLLGTDTSSPYSYTWSNVSAGSYSITAKATDNDGASTTSSSVSITVNTAGGGGGSGSGDLSIEYECGDTNTGNNKIKPYVRIVNDGGTSVNYSDLEVRYYFTMEGSSSPTFTCDYAALGTSNVNGAFVNTGGSDYYLKVTFDSGSGSLSANDDSGNIKLRINKSDWSNHDETNDYSFDGSISSYQSYDKITLYQNGTLVWGTALSGGSRLLEVARNDVIDLKMYPNPVSSQLIIHVSDDWAGGEMQIVDVAGNTLSTRNVSAGTLKMNVDDYSSGVYLLKIRKQESVIVKRFVVE